jgi:hypothetical protein
MEAGLKGFTQTMRSEGRMVSFWANDIARMTDASKEAKQALGEMGGVAAALMSGNAVIIAIEAIKLGVEGIRSLASTSKDEIAELNKALDDLAAKKYAAMGDDAEQAYANTMKAPRAKYEKYRDDAQGRIAGHQQNMELPGLSDDEIQRQKDAIAAEIAALEKETKAYQAVNEAAQRSRDEKRLEVDQARRTAGGNQGPESVTGVKANPEIAKQQGIAYYKDFLKGFEQASRSEERPYLPAPVQVQTNTNIVARDQADIKEKADAQAYLNANTARYAELMAIVGEREEQTFTSASVVIPTTTMTLLAILSPGSL